MIVYTKSALIMVSIRVMDYHNEIESYYREHCKKQIVSYLVIQTDVREINSKGSISDPDRRANGSVASRNEAPGRVDN